MLPYCFLVGAPLLFSLFYNLKGEPQPTPQLNAGKKNYNVIIFFFLLFALLSLRSVDTGIDLSVYRLYFTHYGKLSWSVIFENLSDEIGYYSLNKIINMISGDNFQIMLTVVAFMCCFLIGKFYYEESENGMMTILLFLTATSVFDMLFSGLRQAMAISFAVPAYYCVKNKKIWLFLLCVFLASLFHQSATILILLYPTYHIKLKPVHAAMLLAPAAVITYVFRKPIFKFLVPLAGEEYVDKYGGTQDTGAKMMIILVALFVAFAFLVPDEENLDDETKGLRNILSLSLLLQIFSAANYVAMRFNYYFLLFLPLTIPRIINRWNGDDKNSKNITRIVIIVFFAAYYFYRAFTDRDPLNIYPYTFFWQ